MNLFNPRGVQRISIYKEVWAKRYVEMSAARMPEVIMKQGVAKKKKEKKIHILGKALEAGK